MTEQNKVEAKDVFFVRHEETIGNKGRILVDEMPLCNYSYDRKQSLYLCMVNPFKNAKGFKVFYAKHPSGLAKDIKRNIDKIEVSTI